MCHMSQNMSQNAIEILVESAGNIKAWNNSQDKWKYGVSVCFHTYPNKILSHTLIFPFKISWNASGKLLFF